MRVNAILVVEKNGTPITPKRFVALAIQDDGEEHIAMLDPEKAREVASVLIRAAILCEERTKAEAN